MKVFFTILVSFFIGGCSSLGNTFKDYSNHSFQSCRKGDYTGDSCKCHSERINSCYAIKSKVYAGAEDDLFILSAPFAFASEKSDEKKKVAWTMPFFVIAWPFALVDLPFSTLSDSVLYKIHKRQDDNLIDRLEMESQARK
ncbi:YceK/YidQ family lipoprotein [Pseudogulbenkiania sp. MAI-1]|uniref:YceK/YidQ family lipoprotein n=1 Tax=Pseudogulbenkiania sp. MAI-1 TaxID=990370 RepID=UPI0012EC8940|nr:YceK/YidQ family lipoprotein [Pseudogulbenkiania sp. MAI-1]